jgi:hypothetical protein
MSLRYSNGAIIKPGFNPVLVPGAPTIGAVTGGNAQVIVAFTAPTDTGGSAITSYQVVSSPESVVATGASSPITVTGLTNGTAYTFRVAAINSYGAGTFSASSASATPTAAGQDAFTTAGTFTWIAPAGVTSVSVVAVGGGGASSAGGSGGGLGYKNNYSVTPGGSYTVVVGVGGAQARSTCYTANGGESYFVNNSTVRGAGGAGAGGSYTGDGGGSGGSKGGACARSGGGAGGYAGNGGNGGCSFGVNGAAGSGGGGGGGGKGYSTTGSRIMGQAGGGVGILGQGGNGSGGRSSCACGVSRPGNGGSGGSNGVCASALATFPTAGTYGGGSGVQTAASGGCYIGAGGVGAVRIIYPGTTRSFPSTNTGNL